MKTKEIEQLLQAVAQGELTVQAASKRLETLPDRKSVV